jgi:NTE family protein
MGYSKRDLPKCSYGRIARRYYSAKQFLCSGVPHVYLHQFSTPCLPFIGSPRADVKFFDNVIFPPNIWYVYSNEPLKESLGKFVKFPIATSFDQNQPRLLLVSVDVQEGLVVTFDSYPKDDNGTIRESRYGSKKERYIVSYPDGIKLDYVMAGSSVPVNYDYANISDVNKLDSQSNSSGKLTRYLWDAGILSNTQLRELIQWHKDYWFRVIGNQADDAQVPSLDVYIVDVWPTRVENIPQDHDGVLGRQQDLVMNDKTDYDQKVADILSDYTNLVEEFIHLAKANSIPDKKINDILSKSTKRSKHRSGQPRQYKDLLNGRFDIKVTRIERTNTEYDIYNKMLDFSTETIQHLIQDGYSDATDQMVNNN